MLFCHKKALIGWAGCMVESGFNTIRDFLGTLFASLLSLVKVAIRGRHATRLPPRQRPVCSVLGNGPSLTESLNNQLDFIRQTEIVCVNNFALSAAFAQLRPQNYVMSDPNYFVYSEQNPGRADIRQTLDVFIEQVDWPLTLYVPHFAKGSYVMETIERSNANIKVVYFNYTVVSGFKWLTYWLYEKGLGMPRAQTVI
ncbi:MAG: hypothetical protein JWP57_2599, partial [Spirosoma sp.]|nr:hypothetical protein [Spirosoma sp.]